MKTPLSAILVVVVLAMATSIPYASAAIISTQGAGDGMIGRDWYSSPNFYWVDNTANTVDAYHDGGNRWSYRGMVIFDITSLSDQTIDGATLNYYSNGFSGTSLMYIGSVGPTVTTSYANSGSYNIANLGAETGWQSHDVTSYVQDAINHGYDNIGFFFYATVNYGGGSIASSESGNGAYLNVVPEPASISILALGALGMLKRKK